MDTTLLIITLIAIAIIAVAIVKKTKRRTIEIRHSDSARERNSLQLPPDVKEALAKGKKLEAIKLYKAYAGCSLGQAKSVIERFS